jgi:hypothetical protein
MTGSIPAHAGPLSAAQPLCILTMDHDDSFGRPLFGVHSTPDAGELAGLPLSTGREP